MPLPAALAYKTNNSVRVSNMFRTALAPSAGFQCAVDQDGDRRNMFISAAHSRKNVSGAHLRAATSTRKRWKRLLRCARALSAPCGKRHGRCGAVTACCRRRAARYGTMTTSALLLFKCALALVADAFAERRCMNDVNNAAPPHSLRALTAR